MVWPILASIIPDALHQVIIVCFSAFVLSSLIFLNDFFKWISIEHITVNVFDSVVRSVCSYGS